MNNTSRPLVIGLTYTGTDVKQQDYVNWIKGTDDLIVVQLDATLNNAPLVEDLDGVIFSGGVDVNPATYGSSNTAYPNAPESFNEARDRFEIKVFKLCQQYNKPVLGICRGMQLFNCILGGTLMQDLGLAGNLIHRNTHIDKCHAVDISSGSLLHQITGLLKAETNSAHHQALQLLGKGLTITARSPDGIIEAVEWADPTDKPYLLGIQWHPERMYKLAMQDSPLSTHIRTHFLALLRQRTVIYMQNINI